MADGLNHVVQALNSELQFCHGFGRKGDGKGEFSSPWDVCCDDAGRVYVADSNNHRVQIFTGKGEYLRVFWRCGVREEGLSCPVGIAVSSGGVVYVSDTLYDGNKKFETKCTGITAI